MNVKEIKSSVPEFLQVLLFPVSIDYMSKVTQEVSDVTSGPSVKNVYKAEVAKMIRNAKKKLRENIYDVFMSKKVIRKYPLMKKVAPLDGSEFQKCIIIMAGIDIEVEEISNILQAGEDSILTQRSKRREDIERIFGKKPWMKN
ncbi:MAG: hypothetical protein IKY16_07770 [Bacteroidales bacterium]|nr:hypothetical protein [Bacteroidales bacterium]MBR5014485.1 hypothetical protein [Bacteroidales bacterium]